MHDDYDCWFQRSAEALPASLQTVLTRIECKEDGLVIQNAAAELRRGLERGFGVTSRLDNACAGTKTVLATVGYLVTHYGITLAEPVTPDGFVITHDGERLMVVGANEAGVLYGVYRLLALLRGVGSDIASDTFAPIRDAPACAIRMVNHWDNLDGTIERGYAGRSLFFNDQRVEYDAARITDYARLLASVGINRLSPNNVNVRGAAKKLITLEYLSDMAKLAALFRPFGIRLMFSVNFASPCSVGGLDTADPLEPSVRAWWKECADELYRVIPDLAGFVVKADSEGESGPFAYNRTHADGANMLAEALRPHGGEVIWRCFVYDSAQDWRDTVKDRARAAYDHFKPLDGVFAPNVLLQIKHGPYDFQVREPVSPLFGAMEHTRHLMELQITQEYTGHQIDLCFLPWIWTWVMHFDTAHGTPSLIKDLLASRSAVASVDGLAAVANVGLDRNWTGHTLAQANLYGYGRLAWNPALSAEAIAREWSALSFGDQAVAAAVTTMLLASYPAYEKYNAPFGVCFMVEPGLHYGPNPEGYEFSKWGTYHHANHQAIGIDRANTGTGYTSQYAPPNAALFADLAACPENLLLFFHRVPYDHVMKNGETLLQNIYNTHFEGALEVQTLLELWTSLENRLAPPIYTSVKARLEKQLVNAERWRDVINTYFYRKTGIGDALGRKIFD
ncbi:MAG: alpha-glucuronidase [Treponema sp.]|jgi:alpha-glucuronidase|nr:alpha-glucuronidase [Treponema sp.]